MVYQQLTIARVLEVQQELQAAMGHPMGRDSGAVKENVLAAIVELTEVLAEIPWKPWKNYGTPQIDRAALITEMTDVLQFWANMVNAMGFTAEEVTLALTGKWAENYHRVNIGETISPVTKPREC